MTTKDTALHRRSVACTEVGQEHNQGDTHERRHTQT